MKMRRFVFTADKEGRTDFLIVYNSFRQIDPDKNTKEERPYTAAAQRVLEKISEPIGEAPADADEFTIDLRFRKLTGTEDQQIEISQKLHEKIEAWVAVAKFQSGWTNAIENFNDRWGQAEKFDVENVTDISVGSVHRTPTPGVAKKRN